MQEVCNEKLVEVIAKSLVDHPDEVVVTENEKEDAVIIELKVGPADMGKVIEDRDVLPKRSVL